MENFNEFIHQLKSCEELSDFVGLGNPESNILLIVDKFDNQKVSNTNNIISNDINSNNKFSIIGSKCQYLYNCMQIKDDGSDANDQAIQAMCFLDECYITDINLGGSSYIANDIDRKSLFQRKTILKESDFIQNFPVVVIACSNYKRNSDRTREIDDIFNVLYSGMYKDFGNGNRYYVHYSRNRQKLVIHTRHISASIRHDMLSNMGKLIANHLKKISESLKNCDIKKQ